MMKKIGLIGLLIVLSINAEPTGEGTPINPESQTNLEKAKVLCLHAWAISKEKTTQSYQWITQQIPEKETVKTTWHNSLSWIRAKSIFAKNWLRREAPVKAEHFFSSVKTTCKPVWEKAGTTINTLITKIKSHF